MSGPHGVEADAAKSAIFGFGTVGLRASHGDDGRRPAPYEIRRPCPATACNCRPRLMVESLAYRGKLMAGCWQC